MNYVDEALLDVTERLCRQFQRLTGRTNVWLAVQLTNLSIVVYFVWAAASLLSSDWPVRVVIAVFCGGLLYALTQTVLKVPVESSEQSAYQRVAQGLRNPRRIRDAMLRTLFLMLTVVLMGPTLLVHSVLHLPAALLGYSLIVLTTVLLYVLACDPLPPCPGRLWEWLRGAAAAAATGESAGSTTPPRV